MLGGLQLMQPPLLLRVPTVPLVAAPLVPTGVGFVKAANLLALKVAYSSLALSTTS
jgi:hypothetical protein